nr:deltorphin [Phyllomedusa burmeisteri]
YLFADVASTIGDFFHSI